MGPRKVTTRRSLPRGGKVIACAKKPAGSPKITSVKTRVTTCYDCPSDAMLWIKEVEMVDSLDELKSSRWKEFSKLRDAGRENCFCSEQDHPNSQFKKKVSLEEQKAQKEDRFLRGRQIAFMIYDHFRVTGAHDTVLDHADSFSVYSP